MKTLRYERIRAFTLAEVKRDGGGHGGIGGGGENCSGGDDGERRW